MPIIENYNGKPIIILDPEVKMPAIPFGFGAAKARVILSRITDIENFLINWTDPEERPHKIESLRKEKRKQLDITPDNNVSGENFLLSKYRCRLILKYRKNIENFIEDNDRKFIKSLRVEKEFQKTFRSHTPENIKNPWTGKYGDKE